MKFLCFSPRSTAVFAHSAVVLSLTAVLVPSFIWPLGVAYAQERDTTPAVVPIVPKETPEVTPTLKSSEPLRWPNRAVSTLKLDLSEPPTQEEIQAAGGMGGPLSPLKSARVADWIAEGRSAKDVKRLLAMNWDFGKAIQARNERNFALTAQLMRQYLEEYPDSPWVGEAMLHLAIDAESNGRLAEAEGYFRNLVENLSDDPADSSYDLCQKAKQDWAALDISLGRLDTAQAKLKNILQTEKHWRRLTWAENWLFQVNLLKSARSNLQACGAAALAFTLVRLDKPKDAQAVAHLQPAQATGFSLKELADIARKRGVNLQGFQARPEQLGALPLPLIIHSRTSPRKMPIDPCCDPTKGHLAVCKARELKFSAPMRRSPLPSQLLAPDVGHYLVVFKVNNVQKCVSLFDPTSKENHTLTYAQLEQEWSGVGLMKATQYTKKTLHQQVAPVAPLSDQQMGQIRGGCCCITMHDGQLGLDANYQRVGGSPCAPHGSPMWFVNRVDFNLYLNDVPLWYRTEIGPDIELNLSYNSQSSLNRNEGFGNKWCFNYGSYLVENPSLSVTVFMPDGRMIPYRSGGGGNYINQRGIFNVLNKTGTNTWELQFQDGTKWIYGIPAGINTTSVYLLEQRDPWGYKAQLTYESVSGVVRLKQIADEQGKLTQFAYTDTRTGFQSLITRVTDPFGRFASFAYDANKNLVQMTDMGNYACAYSYDSAVRMTQITTTDGSWQLYWEPNDGASQPYNYPPPGYAMGGKFRLTITDPMSKKEEFFYSNSASSYPNVEQYAGGWHIDKNHYVDYSGFYNNSYSSVEKTRWKDSVNFTGAPYGDPSVPEVQYDVSIVDFPGQSTNGNQEVYRQYLDYNTNLPSKVEMGEYVYQPGLGWGYTPTNQVVTTEFTYNAQGRVTTIQNYGSTNPQPHLTTYNYASNGLDVISVVNVRNQKVIAATYNGFRQPLTVTQDPDNLEGLQATTTMTYKPWGAVATITDAEGRVTTYNYDSPVDTNSLSGTKRLLSITHPNKTGGLATLATFTYDNIGRVRTVTNTTGLVQTYDYDNLNRLRQLTYPDNTYEQFNYSSCCSKLIEVRDRAGRITHYDYDALGRVYHVQDALTNQITQEYDNEGNLLKLTDARGKLTQFEYDQRNRLVKKIYDGGAYETLSYGWKGLPESLRTPRNLVIGYEYDEYLNLTKVDFPYSTDITFAYDELDRMTGMADASGPTSFEYDVLNRVKAVDGPATGTSDKLSYTYTSIGQRATMKIDGSDTQTYSYDALYRLDGLSSPQGYFDYSYKGDTDLVQWLGLPNGTSMYSTFDSLERLKSIANRKNPNNSDFLKHTYSYETTGYVGRDVRTSVDQWTPTGNKHIDYGYDNVDQLKSEVSTDTPQTLNSQFNYDAMGNRSGGAGGIGWQSNVGGTAINRNYTTNSLNQYTAIAATTGSTTTTTNYTYDSAGNLKTATPSNNTGAKWTYNYDDADRLREVIRQDAATSANIARSVFTYDGLSRKARAQEYIPSATNNAVWVLQSEVRYVFDGREVIQERDASGVTKVKYVRGLDMGGGIGGLLSRTVVGTGGGTYFYHYDGAGNVCALTDANQNSVAEYRYDAFGNLISSSGSQANQPYRFSTKEYHAASGFYDYGFRFYSPGMGRWINRDPIGEAGGLNLYGFVGNSPTNAADINGLWGVQFGSGPNLGIGEPSFLFTRKENGKGFQTGLAAVGSSFTFGLWDGGSQRCQLGFGTSKVLADIGRDSFLQAGGAGALKASPRFMSWWGRGVEGAATVGARNRGWYELGQLTLKDSAYAKVSHIADPIARGKEIWNRGLYKNIDLRKAFSFKGTLGTGPAPGARSFLKGAYVAAPIIGETLQGGDCGC